jgi:hypothetical protein
MTDKTSGSETASQGSSRNRAPWSPPAAGGREVRVGIFVILGILGVVLLLFLLTDPGTFRGSLCPRDLR